jgi:flagellar biosynthesis chaperone FliJ
MTQKFVRHPLKSCAGHAEGQDMRPKTRLDPVIKIEEKKEERKLLEMAAAGQRVKTAQEALVDAQSRARADHRRSATAMDWQLAEVAHARALHEVSSAERNVKSAAVEAAVTREAYKAAYAKAEALRRVAATRVEEILAAHSKAEDKVLDEIGTVQFTARIRAA